MTLTILCAIISAATSATMGFVFSQYIALRKRAKEKEEKYKQEREAYQETCKYMLRKFLKDDYEYYVEEMGWCSVTDKAEVEQAYDLYHNGWNGNGQGTRYYKAIME